MAEKTKMTIPKWTGTVTLTDVGVPITVEVPGGAPAPVDPRHDPAWEQIERDLDLPRADGAAT